MNWDVEKLNSKSFKSLERIEHAKLRGFSPKVIFDVGAYVGAWSRDISHVYPDAHILLVEPNKNLVEEIQKNIQNFKERSTLALFAAGAIEEVRELNIWKNPMHNNEVVALAASSLLSHVQGPATEVLKIDVKTIDWMMDHFQLYPDLLKLDLQGFEKDALSGARKCLSQVEMCIIEFGCLDAYEARTTPNDIMEIMYQNNFVLYDIVDLIYRPYDGALVGGDFFFVKKTSKLKSHKDYF